MPGLRPPVLKYLDPPLKIVVLRSPTPFLAATIYSTVERTPKTNETNYCTYKVINLPCHKLWPRPQLPYSLRLLKTPCYQLFYLRIQKKSLVWRMQFVCVWVHGTSGRLSSRAYRLCQPKRAIMSELTNEVLNWWTSKHINTFTNKQINK